MTLCSSIKSTAVFLPCTMSSTSSRSSRVHRRGAAGAAIVPPFEFPPSLAALRPEIWRYLESHHFVVSENWNDFQKWHKRAADAAAQSGQHASSTASTKQFFESYVLALTRIAERHSAQTRADMQTYVQRYTAAMEFMDLWRYSKAMPTVQPLAQVESRVDIIREAYERVLRESTGFYTIPENGIFSQM
ncbi:hypothetical protein DENSPDRAFT_933325 [Dentipellis sp. KUC8613]|nr:hypothetical protein DENSPDRAFT_933325 [Dentipellis sp. KUC8613]